MADKPAHVLAEDFAEFCRRHPNLRFWQALVTWTGHDRILAVPKSNPNKQSDTYYFKGLDD